MMLRITACLLLALSPLLALAQESPSPADQAEPVRACSPKLPANAPCVRICTRTDTGDADCVVPPHAIQAQDPEYSEQARRAGVNGSVLLFIVVDRDGRVRKEVTVERTPGYGLEEQAVRAVREWKFRPATIRGNPVPFRTQVEISFRMSRR